jgi:hypothetical protein
MQNDREKEARHALEQVFDRRKRSSSSAYEERCYELRDIVSDALSERDRYKAALEDLLKNADRVHPYGEHYVIEKAVIDRAVAVKQQTLSTNKDREGG